MSAGKRRTINVVLILLLALTLAFIWGNSLLDRGESAEASGNLMDLFGDLFESLGLDTEDDHGLRKTAHFGEFCALGVELALLFFLNLGQGLQSAANAAFAALLIALTDESLQYISARAPEVRDVALDFAGALTGILLTAVLSRRRKRKQDKH